MFSLIAFRSVTMLLPCLSLLKTFLAIGVRRDARFLTIAYLLVPAFYVLSPETLPQECIKLVPGWLEMSQ